MQCFNAIQQNRLQYAWNEKKTIGLKIVHVEYVCWGCSHSKLIHEVPESISREPFQRALLCWNSDITANFKISSCQQNNRSGRCVGLFLSNTGLFDWKTVHYTRTIYIRARKDSEYKLFSAKECQRFHDKCLSADSSLLNGIQAISNHHSIFQLTRWQITFDYACEWMLFPNFS